MIVQSTAKIFLQEDRGLNEIEGFRSYNTFNFGMYQNDHKKPFGDLYLLNDDTLAAGHSLRMHVEDDSRVILLPVVGDILHKTSSRYGGIVPVGRAHIMDVARDTVIEYQNPYDEGLVNYLQLWLKKERKNHAALHFSTDFEIDRNKNQWIELCDECSIGKFSGREEIQYKRKQKNTGLFAFVIEGAFEVEYRLMHARDGLAFPDIEQVEVEALSNDAIILVAEVPVKDPGLPIY